MRSIILDTSGAFTTVVLAEGEEEIACASYKIQPLSHLHAAVRELLARVGRDLDSVDQIAVVSGPGSWTGLNIGVTAAKTLAQVLSLPIVELSSLDALVAVERWLEGPIYGILDAKRQHVYVSVYATDPAGKALLGESRLELIRFADLEERLASTDGRPLVVEYGDVYRARLEENGSLNVCAVHQDRLSGAGLIAALRGHGKASLEGEAIFELSPQYLQKALGGAC